jgi:antitoxin CptB
MEKIKDLPESRDRLHWACRRGMLELDVLLGNFLNEAYPALNPADQACFSVFLTHPDPDLMAWIMGRETPADLSLAAMAAKIHEHARNRF